MKLKDMELLKLQTKFMQQDATTQAMCAALTPKIKEIADEAKQCLILSRVDELSEELLDELAWQLHIEWYDTNARIDVKRALVKSSDKVHQYLGTPYALEQVIEDYFGDGTVEEWFEYGGEPYSFRVITVNPSVTGELAKQFTNSVNALKRKSANLEEIIIALSGEMNMYFGGIVQTGDNLMIKQVI